MLAIQRKKDGLFYNNYNWVELEKARIFKRQGDLTAFLRCNDINYYLKDGSSKATKGLASSGEEKYGRKTIVTPMSACKIVNVKLIVY